jgi:signal transduction histidine kinase
MNTKFKIIIVTILALLCIRSVVIYNEINHNEEILNKNIKEQIDSISRLINEKREFMLSRYTVRLQNMLDSSTVVEDLYSGNLKRVKKILSIKYLALQREDSAVRTLHLISKDNKTIYRAHKPNKYGDDLSHKRPIVVETNKTHQMQFGYEDGIHDVNFRIDIPVEHNGIHLGVLEIGLDISLVAKKIESIFYHNYVIVLLDEKKLEYYKPTKHIKRFGNGLALYINDKLYKKDIDISNERVIIDDRIYYVDDEHYLLSYNNKEIGKMVHLFDITSSVDDFEMMQNRLFVQSLMILVLLLVIMYTSFTYYENQINKEIEKNQQKDKMLLQQGKLAIMGEMISMIAHQWRQPLAAINMHAQSISLKKRLNKLNDEVLEEKIKDITTISFDMSKTIDDFKNFFKPEKKRNEVEIKSLINDTIKLVSAIFKNNSVKVEIDSSDDVKLNIYDREFSQVIINILNNAKDALVENRKEDRKINIKIIKDDSNCIITIKDNAGGVPKEIIDKIFDPYFSTKSKNGTGLGLYMSKTIIDEHLGGLLSVSNEDDGAVFKIVLPI